MKRLKNLTGVKTLNRDAQRAINGAGLCQVGCNGRTSGGCYGSPNCQCPGECDSGGNCNIY